MTTKTVKRAGMILGGAASLALWAMVIVLACNGGGSSAPDASGSSNPADASQHPSADANPLATGDFMGQDAEYDSTVSGCEVISYVLSTTSGIVASPIGVNSSVHFILQGGSLSVASASGLTMFMVPNHTCTMTINKTASPVTIALHCSNPSGGTCDEVFSKK